MVGTVETFGFIWNEYIRLNLFWIFLAGLVFVRFRYNDRWVNFRKADDQMTWDEYRKPFGKAFIASRRASLRMYLPVFIWLIIFIIPVIVLEEIFGPK